MPDDMVVRHNGFMHHHLETGEKRIIGIGRDVEGLHADETVFPLHLSVRRADIGGKAASWRFCMIKPAEKPPTKRRPGLIAWMPSAR